MYTVRGAIYFYTLFDRPGRRTKDIASYRSYARDRTYGNDVIILCLQYAHTIICPSDIKSFS